MSKEHYYQLVDTICAEYQIPNPAAMYENCNLIVDEVAFTLANSGSGGENLCVYCDFGDVPQHQRALILQRVLEANLAMHEDVHSPSFSYNAGSNHLVLMGRMPIAACTLESTLGIMSTFAARSAEWRGTWFLNDAERVSGQVKKTSRPQWIDAAKTLPSKRNVVR
jgi:Tir chaperone protein (CesT) family